VRVTLDSDVSMRWATSGRQVSSDGRAKTYLAENVRDFNFTAARDYRVRTGTALGGRVQIRVYTRTLPAGTLLDWARRSIERFSSRIGRYPYPTYVVAESSRGAIAMESPALTWIPAGTPSSNLPFLVAHETAHQWFYGVVGNDQARQPFADEAAADFVARYVTSTKRASRCPTGRLDHSIYRYTSTCYYEKVYIQGGNLIDAARRAMGSTAFWGALRGYLADHHHGFGSTRRLLDALDDATPRDLRRTLFEDRFPSLY
jgi:aminopeptidase N